MRRIAICEKDGAFSKRLSEKIRALWETEGPVITEYSEEEDFFQSAEEICRTDLVLMDVSFPGKALFEKCGKLREINPLLLFIFVADRPDLAEKIYEVDPLWFFTRRNTDLFLPKALEKAAKAMDGIQSQGFSAATKEGKRVVRIRDVLYFEQEKRRTKIVTETGTFVEYNKLSRYEEKLGKEDFVRVHNSFLVNMKKAALIGKQKIVLFTGEEIPVSRARRGEVENYGRRMENAFMPETEN